MIEKSCSKCSVVKELKEFPRNSSRKDGRHSRCKPCHNKLSKEYAESESGRKKINAYHRKYSQTKKQQEYQRNYRKRDDVKETINKRNKERYATDSEFRQKILHKAKDLRSNHLYIEKRKVYRNSNKYKNSEGYMRQLLQQSTGLSANHQPRELVLLKKSVVSAKRKIKEIESD